MNFKVIIGVVLLGCFSACKKTPESETKGPNCNDTRTKYISAEISNFKFKKGTYWVYIDSLSLAIDTVKVDTVLSNGLFPYQYCPNNYHEYYSFEVNEKRYVGAQDNNYYLLDETGIKLNPTSENYGTIYSTYSSKTDSLFVYDRYYKAVVMSNNVRTGNNTILYINTDFGFLKKEVFSNSILVSQKLLKDKFIVR